MNDFAFKTNRWGDEPLVATYPLLPTAIWAIAFSAVVPAATFLSALRPTDENHPFIFDTELVCVLALFRLIGFVVGKRCAYATLFACRLDGPWSGRGLAWLALAILYASLLWHLVVFESTLRLASYSIWFVLAIIFFHLLAFARESAFAKQAVVTMVIGTVLLSLLSCALVRAREQSRSMTCANKLRTLGIGNQDHWSFRRKYPSSLLPESPKDPEPSMPLWARQAIEEAMNSSPNRKWVPVD